jgi:hypothetical protein
MAIFIIFLFIALVMMSGLTSAMVRVSMALAEGL